MTLEALLLTLEVDNDCSSSNNTEVDVLWLFLFLRPCAVAADRKYLRLRRGPSTGLDALLIRDARYGAAAFLPVLTGLIVT